MDSENKAELATLLKVLPPVEFCCIYGSALHPSNRDKSTMVDYILGVSDPLQWHSENLKMNRDHYASWMVYLGGAKLECTSTHLLLGMTGYQPFNDFVSFIVCMCVPYIHIFVFSLVIGTISCHVMHIFSISYNPSLLSNFGQMFKYGVVRMHDLVQDILNWERFYLSGRLQKPVHIIVDNLDIGNVNSVNLRAATSAALLLLPSKFTEEELYAKICSLSYMGDLRMLFAEDRNKVMKIVRGQFDLFQTMYKLSLEEYAAKDLLRFSSSDGHPANIYQDCGLSAARSLVSSLPPTVRSQMGMKLGENKKLSESGRVIHEVVIGSREEAAACMQKVVRRVVMVSSARQAVSGLLAAGGVNATRYLGSKMRKAWKSWT